MTAKPTMKRPVRKSSLLVDYSKSKATSDELNDVDVNNVFGSGSPSSSPRAPLRAKPMCCYNQRRQSSSSSKDEAVSAMSLASLVTKGRQRSGSFNIKRDQPQQQQELDESNSSIDLPDLDPIMQKSSFDPDDSQIIKKKNSNNNTSSIKRSGSLLGASHDTLESEGADSFCVESNSKLPSMDLRSSMHAKTMASPAGGGRGGNRRALLQTTRRYQSMSSLSPPPQSSSGRGRRKQQRAGSMSLGGGGGGGEQQPVLSFSLRRRSSIRNINTTVATDNSCSGTTPTSGPGKRGAMSRCKTWDDRSAERFHQSMSALNFDGGAAERFHQSMSAICTDLNDLTNLDATEHTTTFPAQQQSDNKKATGTTTTKMTPSENRRSMLVRHSSVSALQQQPSHLEILSSPPMNRKIGRQSSLRQVFPTNTGSGGGFGSPKLHQSPSSSVMMPDDAETLPDTISIQSRKATRNVKRSKTLDGTSKHGENKKEKRKLNKSKSNGPGALDRHLDRHSSHRSLGGRGSNRRGSDHGSGTRRSSGGSGSSSKSKKTLPTLEVDDMSFSSHSYFSSAASSSRVSRCPSTRGGGLRGSLVASKTPPASRRDVLQRQLSSRRSIAGGGSTNMAAAMALGTSSSNLMDDSSHFVTGSRIRRGRSCRQLLM